MYFSDLATSPKSMLIGCPYTRSKYRNIELRVFETYHDPHTQTSLTDRAGTPIALCAWPGFRGLTDPETRSNGALIAADAVINFMIEQMEGKIGDGCTPLGGI